MPQKIALPVTPAQDETDLARLAHNYLSVRRCAGGRLVAQGLMCPHCESYDPEDDCDGVATVAEKQHIRYTTAPDSYDGFGTTSAKTDFKDNRERHYRCVKIKDDALEWQLNRYGSGLHTALDQHMFKAERERGHYVRPVA